MPLDQTNQNAAPSEDHQPAPAGGRSRDVLGDLRLWRAALIRAIEDSTGEPGVYLTEAEIRSARRWLLNGGSRFIRGYREAFVTACEAAERNPDEVMEWARRQQEAGWPRPKTTRRYRRGTIKNRKMKIAA